MFVVVEEKDIETHKNESEYNKHTLREREKRMQIDSTTNLVA
jgi:hypothetical protein